MKRSRFLSVTDNSCQFRTNDRCRDFGEGFTRRTKKGRDTSFKSEAEKNCESVVALFEGREAIYIEEGAARVRVFDIQTDVPKEEITATVEKIPTPGLPLWLLRHSDSRWEIGMGRLCIFSETFWSPGALWSMFFDVELIAGVLRIAETFPETLDDIRRYALVLEEFYRGPHVHPVPKRVFVDSDSRS